MDKISRAFRRSGFSIMGAGEVTLRNICPATCLPAADLGSLDASMTIRTAKSISLSWISSPLAILMVNNQQIMIDC